MGSLRQRTALMLSLAALAALLLAACGDDESSTGEGGLDIASAAPSGAPLYLDAVVRPEGDQLEGLLSALGTITGEDDPGGLLPAAIDDGLSENGLTYSEDISPWLGSEAGAYLSDLTAEDQGDGAVILSVTDRDAAEAALQKAADAEGASETDASYDGVEYTLDEDGGAFGFVGDFLIGGTEDGFKAAVDASNGDSLADDSVAAEALQSAPENSIFRAYVDPAGLFDRLIAADIVTEQDLDTVTAGAAEALRGGPIVLSGAATADSFSFETSAPAGDGVDGPDLISGLPGGAWLATGAPMVGEAISEFYESFLASVELGLAAPAQGLPGAGLPSPEVPDIEAELKRRLGLDLSKDLDWAGDLSLFVQGTSPFNLGGGITIETDDEQAAAEAVDQLRKAIRRSSDLRIAETAEGFQVQAADAPLGAEVAVRDGKVVVAFLGVTIDDLLSPSETLGDSGSFGDAANALGDGLQPQFFLDIPPIVALVEGLGQASDPGYQEVKPVLDSLNYLIAGSATEGDRAVSRLVLGLQGDGGSAPTASIGP